MAKKFDLDFKKIIDDIGYYFAHLGQDMQIAWGVLGLGIILVVIGILIL